MKKILTVAAILCSGALMALTDAEKNHSGMMNANKVSSDEGSGNGVRILFLGNSITLHGPAPKIGWSNEWGMAASALEKDYVHVVTRGIEARTGRKATIRVRNLADFERNYRTWDVARGVADVADFKPDYLILALGENVPELKSEEDACAYGDAFARLAGFFMRGEKKPRTVVRGVFWPNPVKDAQMRRAAAEQGLAFVSMDAVCREPGMEATGLFWHRGVASHPGDAGMAEIARRILMTLFPN